MGHCKTCKWWGRYKESACDRIDSLPDMDPDNAFSVDVNVLDDSGLYVELITGPNFGCVHWEENHNI